VQTGTPASGEVQFNNSSLASVTSLLISETGRDGSSIPTLLDMLQATTRIIIQSEQLEGAYVWFNISGAPTDNGTYRTVPVTFVTAPTGITTIANLGASGAELTLDFYGVGGGSGVGSGLRFNYDTSSAVASLQGRFARNGASFSAATQISLSKSENLANNPDVSSILLRLTLGAIFELRKSGTAWVRYRSTGAPVLDQTGDDSYAIPVVFESEGADSIVNTDTVYLTIISDAPPAPPASGGSITWTTLSADVTGNANTGYTNNSNTLRRLTLPSSPALGDEVPFSTSGTGGLRVYANNSQNIRGLSQLITGAAKYLQSSNQFAYGSVVALSATEWILKSLPVNMIYGEDVVSLVKSLIHFDQAAGSTAFVDEVVPSRVITAVGSAAAATTGRFGNGVRINAANGQTDHVEFQIDDQLGTNDFCVEFFVRPQSTDYAERWWIAAYRGTPTSNAYGFGANNVIFALTNPTGGNTQAESSNPSWVSSPILVAGSFASWINGNGSTSYHIALTRQGNTYRIFTNGAVTGSDTTASTVNFGTAPFKIRLGGRIFSNDSKPNATYDEFRLTIGDPVYTTAFTAPSAPFTFP
jgi:hypothetical protein